MKMRSDHELLQQFRASRCERSFRMLVERRIDLVHSAAFRVTRSHDLAQDVTQQVFAKLASQSGSISPGLPLSAWLHRTTRSLASNLVRGEERRRRRERTAATLDEMNTSEAQWESLSPVIDEALDKLGNSDRAAILLRFYQHHSHAAIGRALGLTENAARVRVGRAMEKLREILTKRGITTSVAALATVLPAHACLPAPASLAGSVASSALSGITNAGASTTLLTSITMNAKSISVAAACLALLALPAWQQTTLASLQKQRDHLGTGSSPGASRAKVNSGSAFAPQAHPGNGPRPIRSILQLARIKDPLEREAALALWVGGLATNEAILSAIESLKNHPASTPHLRAIIAPHLTRQWALVDPESCIDAFLQSATLHDENPFGAPELSTWSAGFFSLVATTNPEAFERWASNAPDDLFAALIRDPNSDLLKAWAGGDLVPAPRQGPGDALRAILKTAVRFAPELILDIAAEYPESRIAQQQLREWSLVRSLLARHESVDGVWPLLDKLPAGKGSSHLLDALANLSIGEASFEDALATASQRDPGTRQARELDILGKKLADQLGRLGEGELGREDDVWDQLERFAGVINGSASADDPAYDVTRARMAAIAGDADPEVATNWVRSIQDPVTRLRSAGALAARMHADGNYDGSRVSLAQNLGGEDGSFSLRYMMASQDSRMQASMELGKLRIGPERSVDEIMEAVREALDRPDVANMLATISAPHQP